MRTVIFVLPPDANVAAVHCTVLAVLVHVNAGSELLALMRQLARTGGDIDRIPVDLAGIARDEANAATIAFASRGVVLTISIGGELMLQGMPSALRALVAEMLDRALRTSEPVVDSPSQHRASAGSLGGVLSGLLMLAWFVVAGSGGGRGGIWRLDYPISLMRLRIRRSISSRITVNDSRSPNDVPAWRSSSSVRIENWPGLRYESPETKVVMAPRLPSGDTRMSCGMPPFDKVR